MAMLVAIATLDLKSGDEIIASPVSCLASNQPFATQGLKVVWADIHPEMGTLCPNSVESKITKNTKAIFHNHFCGYLGKVDEINALGVKYGIPVIDDAIEAFGSVYKGNKMGNLGTDVTVFSFQTVRLPNTIDGGAIAFKSKALYEKALLVRDYGIDRSNFRLEGGEINPDCDIQLPGYGCLMSELNSYIGLRQMDEIQALLEFQTKNAQKWNIELLKQTDIKPLGLVTDTHPNFWVFGTLSANKQATINYFKSSGYFATGVHINNNIYSVFNNKSDLGGVNQFQQQFVAIPCGWWV
jgi:dTDP-4-amino-4,6-dideoxygalactose transaminase